MSNWILFDVDDVLCNFRFSLQKSFEKENQFIDWRDWSSYEFYKIYDIDVKDLDNHFMKYRVIEDAVLDSGIKHVFDKIKEDGYQIGVITARGWHPDGYNITKKFLDTHNLSYDKIVVTDHTKNKIHYINEFNGSIHGFLDDNFHHVEMFSKHGINAFVLNRPWNKMFDYNNRVYNLEDFYLSIKNSNNNEMINSRLNSNLVDTLKCEILLSLSSDLHDFIIKDKIDYDHKLSIHALYSCIEDKDNYLLCSDNNGEYYILEKHNHNIISFKDVDCSSFKIENYDSNIDNKVNIILDRIGVKKSSVNLSFNKKYSFKM